MSYYYTDEINAQIVLSALKEMNIKKIVVSPGNTNIPISEGVQFDPFFEVYSSVDERSAAYLACGLSKESQEPVALSCTGATASRNYLPGLTEAFYRKLPIVAITSTNGNENIGNLIAQNLDRNSIPNDVAKASFQLPVVKDENDFWYCKHLVNKAFLEINSAGGGPVHINLPTTYKGTYNTKELPHLNLAKKLDVETECPSIENYARIVVFVGSHQEFNDEETQILSEFSKKFDVPILCDHTSNYRGVGRVTSALACSNASKEHAINPILSPELIIHIGEISGDYATANFLENSEAVVWRVSSDGELRDRFKRIEYVFHCSEKKFFMKMIESNVTKNDTFDYLSKWRNYLGNLRNSLPSLPFSNSYIAQYLSKVLPENSNINFGILNSLRSNNFFDYENNITTDSNVGGFGIDGCLSTIVGSSLATPDKLHFLVIGDLAFFYDMNVLGNRHVKNNLRIILVNNKGGAEFKNYSHSGAVFGEKTDEFIAAANHFQGETLEKSPAKAWVTSLGYEYVSASNKEEFIDNIDKFLDHSKKSIIFECFTNFESESESLKIIDTLDIDFTVNGKIKNTLKKHLSNETKDKLKKIIRK
ncbi:2-succinyl-5-enolpyruvyl-6-hydroxy-3-cyclohexene-1-carboxylate synthase [Enterococcus malodoratus]|uniref:thiamine pyrophosphate-binding protein n=1 Tax=Enterococcus malodoratus TaxID=71451 RepID=UPI0008C9A8C7|nr:thiamine pyrophosphate-binding protein [Enterococcus malodoratus]SES96494.1 2-succinyl-5-enolpyruvyl-6-hydroxy-3-cyclohexene-1-carboxylate synthase [Enterococcus malodoratus]